MDDARDGHGTTDLTWSDASVGTGLAGTVLSDRYRLERLIGSGGMAQVWEATDAVLGRRVAVKVLHPHLADDDAFVRRFRQEAIAAARLSNPGIVGVYDTCSDAGHEAIVMELLDATTLRRQLDEHGPLDADTTRRIGLRLLEALEAAHRAGLVHRDVKPSNILLCQDGRVKIADFGIAKAEDQTELTREGSLLGTATYLAPEQLTGDTVDGRADLYALGIVLYECLTGRVPFAGDTGAAVALARLHTTPVDPRRIRADVPPELAAVIMRALARDPDERFESAAAFRAALLEGTAGAAPRAPVGAPVVLDQVPEPEPASFTRSERRWLVPALFILLIAVALTVAGLLVRDTTTPDDPDAGTTTTAPTAPAADLGVAGTVTFDPQGRGDPGENDELAGRATDGSPDTAWRTEQYDQATFFGAKKGVGLATVLQERSAVRNLRIVGSQTGWNASVYVIDATDLDDFDPASAEPTARVEDVRAPVEVPLGDTQGSTVLLWITDLGDANGSGHRVEIAEMVPQGVPVR